MFASQAPHRLFQAPHRLFLKAVATNLPKAAFKLTPLLQLKAGALFLAGSLFLLGTLSFSLPVVAQTQGPDSVADLVESLQDTVVNISTTQKVEVKKGQEAPRTPESSPFQDFFDDFFNHKGKGDLARKVESLGSGFVVDPSGTIVTNNHVIEEADEVFVGFHDGSKLKAQVIGRDPEMDLAVLQVNPKKPLKAVKFADSSKLRVGDWVMAIGNPFGFGGSVTVGIVSARNRDINNGRYDNFIQTDAAINRGNSGGPLFDMHGHVVGINTAIISPSGGSIGIGFAVPIKLAESAISQLREFGETRRGWLGVRIQQVTQEIASSLNMKEVKGALIAAVTAGGPASVAGIEPGDVILKFNGEDVTSMRSLPHMVAQTQIGGHVPVVVFHKGQEKTVTVTLGRLEDSEQVASRRLENSTKNASKILGMELTRLTDKLRAQYNIDDAIEGVLILNVEPNSSAFEKNIKDGEVIVEVAQESVDKPSDIHQLINDLRSKERQSVLLLISNKQGELRFVAIRMTAEPNPPTKAAPSKN